MRVKRDHANYILNLHNDYRAQHSVLPLKWSYELQKAANDHAQKLADRKVEEGQSISRSISELEPKEGVPWGQNLYEYEQYDPTSDMDVTYIAISRAIHSWYNEVTEYIWSRPGHTGLAFSQIVWKRTRKMGLGIGMATKGREKCFTVVAFYDPCGNFKGEFCNNVERAKLFY